MNTSLCSQPRCLATTFLVFLRLLSAPGFAQAVCYDTPHSAIDAVGTNSLIPSTSNNSGYKVLKIQSDSVLRQRWAIVSDCSHPEWPELALRVTGKSEIDLPQETATFSVKNIKTAPIVHAGDVVQLWRQEPFLRIEILGVSEETADLGKTIRVRLLHKDSNDQSAPEHLSGVVRGPFSVEIQR
jgi:Chaperone for flagella basal body P-ring formation